MKILKESLTLILVFIVCSGLFGQHIQLKRHILTDDSLMVVDAHFVYEGDFDGDGDLDILAGGQKKIITYENVNGMGDFVIKQIFFKLYETLSFIDFNGDGDIDIVGEFHGEVFLMENENGLGHFGPASKLVMFDEHELVDIIDLNGDGYPDILKLGSYYELYLNDKEGGVLELKPIFPNNGKIGSTVICDIDGDEDLDIVYTSEPYTTDKPVTYWFENTDGLGSFDNNKVVGSVGITNMLAVDVDGDSDVDIIGYVFENFWDRRAVVYKNLDGLGNFSDSIGFASSSYGSSFLVEDFDNDGDLDLLERASGPTKMRWFENTDSEGAYEIAQNIQTNSASVSTVATGDMDGDGDIDILSASYFEEKIAWYHNTNGKGLFGNEVIVTSNANNAISPRCMAVADIDNDGDNELIFSSKNKIGWYQNLNGTTFSEEQNLIYTHHADVMAVADVDLDGDTDLVVSIYNGYDHDTLAWFENMGGYFSELKIINLDEREIENLYLMDMDQDGDVDIIGASKSNYGHVFWIENTNGLGAFSITHVIAEEFKKLRILSVDMDGDEDFDILLSAKQELSWVENIDGNGLDWNKHNILDIPDENSINFLNAVDMNGDSKIDIVFSRNELGVFWLKSIDGMGAFSEGIQVIDGAFQRPYVLDIDNDGDMDICTIKHKKYLGYLENLDHLGTFSDIKIIASNMYQPNSLAVIADVNNDSRQDIVVYTSRNDRIEWFENLGAIDNKIVGTIKVGASIDQCDSTHKMDNFLVKTVSDASQFFTSLDVDNSYNIFPNVGTFITSLQTEIPDYFSIYPASGESIFPDLGNIDTVDFCIVPNKVAAELGIILLPSIEARLGSSVRYPLVMRNMGTASTNGSVILHFNPELEFLGASDSPVIESTDSLVFDFLDLNIFESKTIDVDFKMPIPPILFPNDTLLFLARITPIAGDVNSDNNSFNLKQVVVGSYDPNDITVLEGSKVLYEDRDDYLHYVIRFQNTGNAKALKVRVHNSLDANLDPSTFQLESTSHHAIINVENNRDIDFIFDGINLPDSTSNEIESHGFIAYKVKPIKEVVAGAVITNSADIFFDSNPPVLTNSVSTEIVLTLQNSNLDLIEFGISPIPVSGVLTIKCSKVVSKVELFNSSGHLVKSISHNDKIDVSGLEPGLFFIRLTTFDGQVAAKAFVKY